MIKLSVVIITFNEEKNIHSCIESVSEIADDIVVLDSFSTDNTEKIGFDSGVRFIKHPFDGYKEQKNRA
ncbi:MAG: glycosyltransferase, partial [Bacteroidota bacterium]|nr:glycosyltransferase [Bacteroidota bacterium]